MMKHISLMLKIISGLVLILAWVFIILNFQKLPASIPIHFGFDGKPDNFGPRSTIWILLVIQTLIFSLLLFYSRNPMTPGLNIPFNLKQNKTISEFVVSTLLFLMMLLFGLICYETTQNALEQANGLSSAASYILILLLIWLVGIFVWSGIISKKNK